MAAFPWRMDVEKRRTLGPSREKAMSTLAPKRKTLVVEVRDKLKEQITSGDYRPGDRLPSEASLTEAHGVSRTVIREAIASLRADGLVDSRRGAGVFVIEPVNPPIMPFQSANPEQLSSMIELLELRTAIEVEAAGLAAIRHSPAQEEKILKILKHLEELTDTDASTHEADFALHLAIAEASNNKRFADTLSMLGATMIPRHALHPTETPVAPEYTALLKQEHRDIVYAVLDGDEDGARQAMRMHLKGSQARYKKLLRD